MDGRAADAGGPLPSGTRRHASPIWNPACGLCRITIRAPKRDALADWLRERGIATRVYYPRTVPAQPCFADLGRAPGSFPVSERLAREVLSLPIYPGLRPEQVERVAREIRGFYERTPAGTNADGGNP